MCTNEPIQACSCCPKSFCTDHAVAEAHNAMHPISYGKCEMFICNFCQYNSDRIGASHVHTACLQQNCYSQELFTANGLWLSMYLKNPGPPLTAKAFSAQCFKQDLVDFEQKVRVQNRVKLPVLSPYEKLQPIPLCRASQGARAGSRPAETLDPCTGWRLERLCAAARAWCSRACIPWNRWSTGCQNSRRLLFSFRKRLHVNWC